MEAKPRKKRSDAHTPEQAAVAKARRVARHRERYRTDPVFRDKVKASSRKTGAAARSKPGFAAGKFETKHARRRDRAGWLRYKLSCAKDRARDKALPFDISVADIDMPETCPYLGLPLLYECVRHGAQRPANLATLDKLRPELGYVKGNIVVCSHRANRIKSDATLAELRAIGAKLEALLWPENS